MKQLIYNILLMTLIGCASKTTDTEEKVVAKTTDDTIFVSMEQWEKNQMELINVEEKQFPKTIKVVGKIEVPPKNRVVVSAKMGGYIKNTPLLVGDKVVKGQRLVTIENQEFVVMQQNYLETKQQIDFLKSEFERQKALFDEKITSERNYLKAKRDYEVAQTTLKSLQKQLEIVNIPTNKLQSSTITSLASVYAPISGNITKIKVVTGSHISPADEILEIIDNSHLHLELSVFEKDALKLKIGQEITFTVPELSTKSYEAKVHLIGKSINDDRTVDVHAHIEDEEKRNFLAGMFTEATIVLTKENKRALPETSVAEVEGAYYALQLVKNTNEGYFFKKQKVTLGDTFNDVVEVQDTTLQKDAQFLKKGVFNLLTE
ncbi:efflux RND transporter periplasmic adaptor subunit [Tenacibaculum sp. TC6]|uniref:efflux RND transporter periplasmic adaptor subunit n=1 Tax=Tenacibaculum sp. TC6 TaxID=3423223 RepID=UPI003D36A980